MNENTIYNLSNAMLCMKVKDGYCLMSEINDETFYTPGEYFDDELKGNKENLILVLDYCMNTQRILPIKDRTIDDFTSPLFKLIPNKESRIELYKALKKASKRFFYETFARDLQETADLRRIEITVTEKGNISVQRRENP